MTIRDLQEVFENWQEIRIGVIKNDEIEVSFWGKIQNAPEKYLDINISKIMIRNEKMIIIHEDESENKDEKNYE